MVKRKTIEDCQALAELKNGKCLATSYTNSSEKIEWQCKLGHRWFAIFSSIKHGRWCPHCSKTKKKTIQDCQSVAKEKNGLCLSQVYINHSENLLWECEYGHQWMANFNNIKFDRSWCPYCSGKIKKTIEECREIANRNEGKCLSEIYINAHEKLLWECRFGHTWKTSYEAIRMGSWCPNCSEEKKKQTCLQRYGVEYVQQSKEIRQKKEKTNLKKYGTKCSFQNKDVQEKYKNTCLEKYGVDSTNKVKEISLKQAKSQNHSYILHHWKTNEEIACVGSYEKKTVEFLNTNQIDYEWQSKVFPIPELGKTYLPDLYLPEGTRTIHSMVGCSIW